MDKLAAGLKAKTRIWPIILLVVIAIVVAGLATWNVFRGLSAIIMYTDARAQARAGRLEVLQLNALLKDVETGVRGFAITGRDEFLEHYYSARTALPEAHAQVKRRLTPYLPTGYDWSGFEALLAWRLDLLVQTINKRVRQGSDALDDPSLFEEGRKASNEIRRFIEEYDDLLQGIIRDKDATVQVARRHAQNIGLSLLGMTLLLLLLATGLILRERRLRQDLERYQHDLNRQLEIRVAQRTAELAASEHRIANFAIEQDRAIEQERRRVAREVHDQIGQVFTAIKLILMSARRDALPDDQTVALNQAVESGIVTARRITADLRPPLLDDLGLAAALEHHARAIAQAAQLECSVAVHDHERLNAQQALGLFRIAQEATTNIVRHAGARHIWIAGYDGRGRYHLVIADDGHGFDATQVRQGAFGLESMRERASLMQGNCEIAPGQEGGTVVTIDLPLEGSNKDGDDDAYPAA